ncbi:MAG: hypothetical protein HUJ83_05055 [Veillonella sp.]|nr:hypothetical protein [Veillonella sp.]
MDKLDTITVSQLKALFPNMSELEMGNDFFLGNVEFTKDNTGLEHPFRVDAYVAIICMKGELEIGLNLKTFNLKENMVLVYIPGNIMNVKHIEDGQSIIFAMSGNYMSSLQIDFNNLFNDSMAILNSPCFKLSDDEITLCRQYSELGSSLIKADIIRERKEALGALISSMYYAVGSSWKKKLVQARSESGLSLSGRDKAIFDHSTLFTVIRLPHNSTARRIIFAHYLANITRF